MQSKLLLCSLSCLLLASFHTGCAGMQSAGQREIQNPTTRNFFERTIVYTIEPGARDHMMRLERLADQVFPEEKRDEDGQVPDRFLITLYRDADVDRNFRITEDEARQYYQIAVTRLEDRFSDIWRAAD
ncbi:MAG: hypothetical protein EA377_11615 [Phycisphaerales bacterium]|nr:MAG: hypothetical protein EA377_11615 [Phycisphaerales bacterium]